MYKILNKQIITPDIKRIDIHAPDVAARAQAGQFVMIAPDDHTERLALPIVDADTKKGSVALIFQENSPSALMLGERQINDEIECLIGPLGNPFRVKKFGTVVCVTTGLGSAAMLSLARSLKKEGNKVLGVMGSRTKRTLLLEPQMRILCHKIFVATEDGSYIKRGQATDLLKEVLKTENVQAAYVAGSPEMMEAAARLTKEKNIPTWALLSPVMLDGTGQCGSCRLSVGGRTLLACEEGPVFDAHQVDFADYRIRLSTYRPEFYRKGNKDESWDKSPSQSSPATKDSGVLTRWFSGLVKKTP